ncbi:MAG: hypothetical protein IT168_33175 [Bryobacterales bacterium]|nr:hypothetical protein [Bryobacterales bacterium]
MPGGFHLIYPNALPARKPDGKIPNGLPVIQYVVKVEDLPPKPISKGQKRKRRNRERQR